MQFSKKAEHRSEGGRANANAQWSADPERGWVRADERHGVREPRDFPNKRGHGRETGKGKSKKL